MAEIKIQAVLERANFDSQVKSLNEAINKIANTPIKIKVEANGIEGDVKALAQLATAQARVAEAEAKIASAHARSEAAAAKKVQTMTQLAKVQAEVEKSANKVAEAETKSQGAVQKEHEKTQQVVARTVKAQIEGNSRVAAEKEKTIQSENKMQQQLARTEQEAIKASAAQVRGAKEVKDATDQVAESTNRVGEMLAAMAIRGAWRIITSEIREALSAMQAVDKELVTIRKVTGFSQGKINEIGQSAYQTASQYGVLPQDYLASVANFARAGYKETSTSLGELAVKTQLVGDVSQDTANKMLLAVDAAYKLNGSTEALSAVLDGMNEIDNNFATSIDKIASGIGKVTSIGAQAHVSIGELSSAIGTITAVTQRSGTEAATALRALFLNIMGDTKTEIEDGAKWTAGEIQGLRDVLAQYAPEVINAAAATGQLINPMEAIGALAQSMKDGLLSEQKLMAMVSDIGGKLRSSQLLALIQNWDMYQDMLSSFEGSAGSAGREVANMLDSWDVKANQLSTSWTKMVADVVDTSFIKGTLDFLRSVVTLLDAGGGLPAKLMAVAAAVSAVSMAFKALSAGNGLTTLMNFISNPYAWAIAGGALAISGIVGIIDNLVQTQQELDDAASKSADTYASKKGSMISINEQVARNYRLIEQIEGSTKGLTDKDKERLTVLKQQTAELEMQARYGEIEAEESGLDAATAAAAAMKKRGRFSETAYSEALSGWNAVGDWRLTELGYDPTDINDMLAYYTRLQDAKRSIDEKIRDMKPGDPQLQSLGNQRKTYLGLLAELEPQINKYLKDSTENGKTINDYLESFVRDVPEKDRTTKQDELVAAYDSYTSDAKRINEIVGEAQTNGASGVTTGGNAPARSEWAQAIYDQDTKFRLINKAIQEFNESVLISVDTVKAMQDANIDLGESLLEADKGYKISTEDLRRMSSESREWYEKYGVGMPETMASIGGSAEETSATLAELANNALTLQDNASGAAKALNNLKSILKETGEKGDTFKALQTEYANVMKLIEEGRWNSNEARGFMDMLFGPDAIKEVGGYQVMSEWLGKDYFKSFFTDDALTTLEKWAKTLGEVKDENGELIASFAKNDDGTFDVLVNDIDKLSQRLKIPSDMLAAFFDELGNFGNVEDFGDVEKLVDGMSEGVKTLEDGTKKVSFASFVQQLQDAGASAQKISELVSTIRDSEKISFDIDETGIKDADVWVRDLWASLKNLQDKTFKPRIQAEDDTEDGTTKAKKSIDDVQQKSPAQLRVDTLDISAGTKNAQSLIDKIKQDNPPKLTAEDDTDNGVDCAQSNIDSLEQKKVPPLKANDEITPVAKDVQDKIDSLRGKTVRVRVIYTKSGNAIYDDGSRGGGVGKRFGEPDYGADSEAEGTNYAQGGPTLVNEKGPELIADNGRAFVANSGRPTIVNLSRGAIVYNADETRELLVGSGISSYGIESRAVGTQITPKAFGVTGITPGGGKTNDKKDPPTGGGNTKKKKSDDEWWQILQESYEYALAKAKDTVNQLDLKITHIKNEIADAKRPLEDQIKEYEKINKQIDRQIQLLNRAKERATKPIQDQIDALKAQKDVQDEQLALEEKQKAVEEARAALQNAQQERTIRFYNQETGHWEWMADQRAIDDAQKNLDSAEKALADQEFNMQISALEREKDRIEKEFDDQITQLNEQKTVNEDAIYALNEAIDAIDDAYAPELNALEREKELMDRELSDTEAEWAHLQFQRQKKPKGNVNKAANKLGAKGKAAKEIIDSLSGSIKDIESAAAAGTLDALTASVANSLIYGSPSTVTSAVGTGIGNNGGMADSHDIIINGIVFSNEGAYKSFTDGLAALGIYAGE